MCLIVFAYKIHPQYKLILVSNRDEFYDRPTASANWWEDKPTILGGRDLKARGTWMGVSKSGRFAAVTNYRDIQNIKTDTRSRGDLPVNFLDGSLPSKEYGELLNPNASKYNGFNLLAFDEEMIHYSNYEHKVKILKPGIYGLSNALLDTPWTKVLKAKEKLKAVLKNKFSLDELVSILNNSEYAPDEELPETGLNYEMEKALSAMCIRTPKYGTCCSTALTIGYDGVINFLEKSYPVGDREDASVKFDFKISE